MNSSNDKSSRSLQLYCALTVLHLSLRKCSVDACCHISEVWWACIGNQGLVHFPTVSPRVQSLRWSDIINNVCCFMWNSGFWRFIEPVNKAWRNAWENSDNQCLGPYTFPDSIQIHICVLKLYNTINTAFFFSFFFWHRWTNIIVYDHALWVLLTSSAKQKRVVDWGWSACRPIIWPANHSFVVLNHSNMRRCKREHNVVPARCLWIVCLCTHTRNTLTQSHFSDSASVQIWVFLCV